MSAPRLVPSLVPSLVPRLVSVTFSVQVRRFVMPTLTLQQAERCRTIDVTKLATHLQIIGTSPTSNTLMWLGLFSSQHLLINNIPSEQSTTIWAATIQHHELDVLRAANR